MRDNLFLSFTQLERFHALDDWSSKAHALLLQQESTWALLCSNYDGLKSVESKTIELDGFSYRVQFNPGRIASSAAKVDEKSIRERKCFLCADNLPEPQRGLMYGEDFLFLCNPFPIFPQHFTVPNIRHIPQEIRSSFATLLQLSKDLEERYLVFYNGPKCGASAPDHLHFQAGDKGFMPIDDEYETIITSVGEKIADVEGLLVFAAADFRRRFISFESDDATQLANVFEIFYEVALECSGKSEEPMMNILSSYQEGEWRVIVFPRTKHRPSFFFLEGKDKILISPAGVDFGGVVTTPLESDYLRVDEEHLMQMFDEVSASPESFDALVNVLTKRLAGFRR